MSDSDDEAPEEFSLKSSKEGALQQIHSERVSERAAKKSVKDRNKQGQRGNAQDEEPSQSAPEPSGGDVLDSGYLPEDLFDALASKRSERAAAERAALPSRGLEVEVTKKRKKKKQVSSKLPVIVEVLKKMDKQQISAAASSFLKERLHSSKTRSVEMLLRGRAGFGPASKFT
jgi:hypothetical protein